MSLGTWYLASLAALQSLDTQAYLIWKAHRSTLFGRYLRADFHCGIGRTAKLLGFQQRASPSPRGVCLAPSEY